MRSFTFITLALASVASLVGAAPTPGCACEDGGSGSKPASSISGSDPASVVSSAITLSSESATTFTSATTVTNAISSATTIYSTTAHTTTISSGTTQTLSATLPGSTSISTSTATSTSTGGKSSGSGSGSGSEVDVDVSVTISLTSVLTDLENGLGPLCDELTFLTSANVTTDILTTILTDVVTLITTAVTDIETLVGQSTEIIFASLDGSGLVSTADICTLVAAILTLLINALAAVLKIVSDVTILTDVIVSVGLGDCLCSLINAILVLVTDLLATLVTLVLSLSSVLVTLGLSVVGDLLTIL